MTVVLWSGGLRVDRSGPPAVSRCLPRPSAAQRDDFCLCRSSSEPSALESASNAGGDDGVFDPYSGVRGLAGAGMLPDECRGAEVSVRDLEVLPRFRTSGRCRSGSRGVNGVAPLVGASVLLRSGFRVVA